MHINRALYIHCILLFKSINKDNDGSITIEELRKYYLPMQEMLGIRSEVAEQEIQGLVKRLDSDNNGSISFEEFKLFCSRL
ncbi:unnamed protein product [Adineta ricciae]|uniref:EF-hand domain-containing protein n=1 Tax=Adineta ricciae TaxID=249248 RepID=A0A813WY14_ADIRI|nr:unnamed protein product [Adineta ricciae]